MIAVVDYGAGNLKSVSNAFEAIGRSVRLTSNPGDLADATAIVLPGVGAFGDGMASLARFGLVEALHREVRERGKPYLGICLGLQFLAEVGYENGQHPGLGWLRGAVRRIEPSDRKFKVPHMGWNELVIERDGGLLASLPESPVFYFLHSYHLVVAEPDAEAVTSTCWHGTRLTATVERDNVWGVQFHPEKSQQVGLQLLKNFVSFADRC